MGIIHGNTTITALTHGSTNITTALHGDTTVFTSGYTVTITSGTYASCYVSTAILAMSGSTSITVPKGTTIYAFVKLTQRVGTFYINPSWKLISGTNGASGAIYRVAAVQINKNYDFGTIHARTLRAPTTYGCDGSNLYVKNPNTTTVTWNIEYFYIEDSTGNTGEGNPDWSKLLSSQAQGTYPLYYQDYGLNSIETYYADASFAASGYNSCSFTID